MSFISIARLATLCLSLLFGLVVLGLSARWTQATASIQGILYNFEVVALLASVLTLVIVPVILVLASIRKGAFTSMIAAELPILAVLWILWLISAALTADVSGPFYPFGCVDALDEGIAFCRQFMAIEALSFLVWLLLIIYSITLLTFTLIAQSRGNNVWKHSVNDVVFFPQNTTPAPVDQQYTVAGAPATVTPQFQYPPAGVPMQQAATPASTQYSPYSPQTTVSYPASNSHSAYPQV